MSDQREIIIELFGAAMKYGSGPDVLRDIDLTVQAGSFLVIVGASSAGKTTLLATIARAAAPPAGRLTLFGRDTARIDRAERARIRRRIGLVCQELRLLDHLSAAANLALPLRIAGLPAKQARPPVVELMDWLGITGLAARRPGELSAAERQLLSLGRAVIGRPDLLLADEPTSLLDGPLAHRALHLLGELNRAGTTILLATHDPALPARVRGQAMHLADGRLHPALPTLSADRVA
ncbi:cell division ATP-binding protein FtsE [Geminicoccus harenae]|uniref:cell division ATP-binding protein FtsE n=1 Tax=Geminicoccus harenae TaxID=2498453 RepID=UPI001C948D1A|nr:ATP-binding cassette domain-containing protein [Geminicoccus harenae]